MKKRFLVMAALAAMVGVFSIHASASEELMADVRDAMADQKNIQVDADLDFGLTIGISGDGMDMNMDVTCTSNAKMETCQDPVGAHVYMDMNLNAMGEEQNMSMEFYAVQEGDSLISYTGQDGSWTMDETAYDDEAKENVEKLFDYVKELDYFSILSDAGIEMTEEDTADGNTVVTAQLKGMDLIKVMEALMTKVKELGEELGEDASDVLSEADGLSEQAEAYEPYLEPISADLVFTIDSATNLISSITLDLTGTDVSYYTDLVASMMGEDADAYEVSMDLTAAMLTVNMTYDDTPIVVPEDVKAAAEGEAIEEET